MSLDVTAETRISRPPDEVAVYLFDPVNDPVWIGGIREARLLGDPPIAVGSRVARLASFLGRRIRYVNEVVELEPARRLRMHSISAPFPMDIEYSLSDDGAGGTVFRNRVRGGASGFLRIATPIQAPLVRRAIQRDAERLRDVLEGGGGGAVT
jgi:hypothetical protein